MSHVTVSNLAYAHPGGDTLFEGVSFRLAPGSHAALVGVNGVGKTTLLRILAGDLEPIEGEAATGGRVAYMAQDVGTREGTVRELLLGTCESRTRSIGERVLRAERALARGDAHAGMDLGSAISEWSELGGYEIEGRWDAACRRIVRAGLDEVGDRPAATLSGGERKRLVLDLLFASDASVLLLDEPDNFLDVPAKRRLEEQIASTKKTVLFISHDREVLAAAPRSIVTLEGSGAWVHGGSYTTYGEAREARQQRLGDALARWKAEERRLHALMKTFKERARYSSDWAKRADAAETRWRRWVDAGPPPAPVSDQRIVVRMRGGDSARRVLDIKEVAIDGLVRTFSDEIHYGERVGLIGPNGAGKTHLMRLLAGEDIPHSGRVAVGNRVSPGFFTQLNVRPDFGDRPVLDVVLERRPGIQRAMQALARYGLVDAARRPFDTLSGGQKARLEILCLELEGHNLLLLDEPTDNLDVESAEALEQALDGFEGAVVAVSHDRAFLRTLDRFILVGLDGRVRALPDPGRALEALGA